MLTTKCSGMWLSEHKIW